MRFPVISLPRVSDPLTRHLAAGSHAGVSFVRRARGRRVSSEAPKTPRLAYLSRRGGKEGKKGARVARETDGRGIKR